MREPKYLRRGLLRLLTEQGVDLQAILDEVTQHYTSTKFLPDNSIMTPKYVQTVDAQARARAEKQYEEILGVKIPQVATTHCCALGLLIDPYSKDRYIADEHNEDELPEVIEGLGPVNGNKKVREFLKELQEAHDNAVQSTDPFERWRAFANALEDLAEIFNLRFDVGKFLNEGPKSADDL